VTGILGKLILLPSVQQWHLLDVLGAAMFFFFLPFAGALLVCHTLALLLRRSRESIAAELVALPSPHPGTWFVFGLLPLAALAILESQRFYGTAAPIGTYLLRVFLLGAVSFALLYLHARRRHPLIGLAGIAMLGGTVFHLMSSLDLAIYAERWTLITTPLPFFISILVVIDMGIFSTAALAFTGALILVGPLAGPPPDARDETFRRNLALGLILAGALGLPPLIAWHLYSAPVQVLSGGGFIVALGMLAALFALAVLAVTMLRDKHRRHAAVALVLSLVTLALFAVQHRRFEYRATYEYGQKGEMLAAAAHKEWKAKREALYAGAQPPDAQQGEAIYKARCSSCHAFDRKIVGPPYREVVPKYAGDPDDLVAFILKPRRMNPAYPPMPSPGLRRPEAQSAAMYLLQQTGTGAP